MQYLIYNNKKVLQQFREYFKEVKRNGKWIEQNTQLLAAEMQ